MAFKSQFGACYDLPSVEHIALASKMRLVLTEPFLQEANRWGWGGEGVRGPVGGTWHGRAVVEGL
eukprot:8628183-Lingulodinium_polyedra.AAC.1